MRKAAWVIKFEDNYADEFTVRGFRLVKNYRFIECLKEIAAAFVGEGMEWYFGSNEFIEYNTVDDLMRAFTVTEITLDEAETISKAICGGNSYYGKMPCIEDDNAVFDTIFTEREEVFVRAG